MVIVTGTPEAIPSGCDDTALIAVADELRVAAAPQVPDPAVACMARMQQAMTAKRCTLATFAIDGLLQKAAAEDVLELSGSLFRLRCSTDPSHPRTGIFGLQPPGTTCTVCGSTMRPDVVLPGEPSQALTQALEAVQTSRVLLVVGAPVAHPTVKLLLDRAREVNARRWQVDRHPEAALFDEVLAAQPEVGLPRLVARWLDEELTVP